MIQKIETIQNKNLDSLEEALTAMNPTQEEMLIYSIQDVMRFDPSKKNELINSLVNSDNFELLISTLEKIT